MIFLLILGVVFNIGILSCYIFIEIYSYHETVATVTKKLSSWQLSVFDIRDYGCLSSMKVNMIPYRNNVFIIHNYTTSRPSGIEYIRRLWIVCSRRHVGGMMIAGCELGCYSAYGVLVILTRLGYSMPCLKWRLICCCVVDIFLVHDDVIKWKHFPRY